MPSSDDDDTVGYGRPPKQHRFQKGRSGNPKGRPKKKANGISDEVERFSAEEVTFREGGEHRTATRDEVGLRALRSQAIAGDIAAAEEILRVLNSKPNSGSKRIVFVGGLPD